MPECRGAGRPVAIERWRTFYRCPACGKRLRADDPLAASAPHPTPRYHNIITPRHDEKVPHA